MAFPEEVDPTAPSPVEQLKIAFAAQIARDIVSADQILDIDEVRLMMMVFPDAMMRRCGYIDDNAELTGAFHRAYGESLRVLPKVLNNELKLELVTLFHRTCVVDGELHPAELQVLRKAAHLLEIDQPTLEHHLNGLHGSLASLAGF